MDAKLNALFDQLVRQCKELNEMPYVWAWYSCLQVVYRIAAVSDVNMQAAMVAKYGHGKCQYCSHRPCCCDKQRDRERHPHIPNTGYPERMQWTLRQWQNHLHTIYPNHKPFNHLHDRLMQEVNEAKGETDPAKLGSELADVVAWLCAIANHWNI